METMLPWVIFFGLLISGLVIAAAVYFRRGQGSELVGRLDQLSSANITAHSELVKTVQERLDSINQRMGTNLEASATKTAKSIGNLERRLKVIDKAQENMTSLSKDIIGLQNILENKQLRGTFGEIQLNDLVSDILPPNAYSFQETLSNGKRPDCLLKLPNPPGSIVVDAKFPLESYRALEAARGKTEKISAERDFRDAILTHVKAIKEKYIIPGETANSAFMFLPSEAVYAELHAHFAEVVDKSHIARVWIVSPTTLMATLTTIRAVLKDVEMQEQAGLIQAEVGKMLQDVIRLDKRVSDLAKHFESAEKDIHDIQISTGKISKRSVRIRDVEFDNPVDEENILPSEPAKPRLVE